MATTRTPRRLVKLVRYLESVLEDPRATPAMKTQASGRLTELFIEGERTKERAAIALERARARQLEAEQGKSTPVASDDSEQTDSVPDTQSDTVAAGLEKVATFMAQFKQPHSPSAKFSG